MTQSPGNEGQGEEVRWVAKVSERDTMHMMATLTIFCLFFFCFGRYGSSHSGPVRIARHAAFALLAHFGQVHEFYRWSIKGGHVFP